MTIKTVAPSNMGKGIEWNKDEKKYEVSISENSGLQLNDNGELELRVSALESNQLRLLNGELYQGTKSSNHLLNLYVDAVNGVDITPTEDNGAGTRAKPLKTFAFALKQHEYGASQNIWLHENQTHIMSAKSSVSVSAGSILVQPYGSIVDSLLATSTNRTQVHIKLQTQGLGPVVQFNDVLLARDSVNAKNVRYYTPCIYLYCSLTFDGISMEQNLDFTISDPYGDTTIVSKGSMSRIACYQRAMFYFSRGRITCVGSVKTTLDSNILKEGFDLHNGMSGFGFVYIDNASTIMYNQTPSVNEIGCYYLADKGSGTAYNSTSLVGVLDSDATLCEWLSKRIYEFQVENQNGVKQALAPITNIPSKYLNVWS
ncbi:hypothetical protein [Lonepinella sp. BR2474]|uniref:hypothetical protein n=1 Tax=Lonepinella sp. BR2474 TaxID=3434548 RepID=UPI003F6DC9C8